MTASPLAVLPVFIGLALHISGCAAPLSPQADCFADATVAYRSAWRAAQALRTDLDRGHALHRVETHAAEPVPCRVGGRRATCLHRVSRSIALPAPIDRPGLKARLAALEARMQALRPAAMERAAPCGYGEYLARTGAAPALP